MGNKNTSKEKPAIKSEPGRAGRPSYSAFWISGACVLAAYLLLACLFGRIIIDGDGLSYYALTMSLVHDQDFDLQNQKKELQGVMAPLSEITGKPASLFSCGFGVLYAPLLAVSEKIELLAGLAPYPQNNRIPFAHAVALFTGSLLCALAALLLAFVFVIRRFAIHPAIAALFCMAAFVGTPLLFYSLTMPSYSHAADAFLVTLLFTLVLSDWKSPWRNVLAGAVLSLSVLLRNNNIVFWPVVVGALLWKLREQGGANTSAALRTIAAVLSGALPFLILHGWFNLTQYGKLLTTGYRVQMQEGFLSEMLLHPDAGLFIWAPVALLAVIGLIGGSMQKRTEAIFSLVAVIFVFVSVQFQGNWWGGCSFGQRFFTHLFFFWVVGLAQFSGVSRKAALALASACALWTFLLFNSYLVNAGSVEGRKVLSANRCRRTPMELLASAESQYLAARSTGSASGRFQYWTAMLSSRPYPTVWFLFRSAAK